MNFIAVYVLNNNNIQSIFLHANKLSSYSYKISHFIIHKCIYLCDLIGAYQDNVKYFKI